MPDKSSARRESEVACAVCASPTFFLMSNNGYRMHKCSECGLVFVWPKPEADFLASKVYSKESGYQGGKAQDLSKVAPTESYLKILSYLERIGKKGSLLDVGCSNGEFLYHVKKKGFDVEGIELNPHTAEIARKNGIKVTVGRLEDVGFDPESFDVIFLGDIIEHVADPRQFLVNSANLLKKGGMIIISTPNLDCFWSKSTFIFWRMFAIPWSSVAPPYHLFQFSKNNITMLLGQVGLESRDFWCCGRPRLGYELHGTGIPKVLKVKKYPIKIIFALYAGFAYLVYSVLYRVADTLKFLGFKNDFAMIVTAQKR